MGVTGRLAYIDGLRAIAALSVLLMHSYQVDMNFDRHTFAAFLLGQGAHGVDLFFVLSGFCLSYPILDKLERAGRTDFNLAAYAARRLVRIVPPYYATIVILTILLIWTGYSPGSGGRVTGWDLLRQLFFVDHGTHFLSTVFWTLAVEFRWYVLFPLVIWILIRWPAFFYALLAVAIPVSFIPSLGVDAHYFPGFLLGVVAAQIEVQRWPVARYALYAFIVAFCLTLVLDPIRMMQWAPPSCDWEIVAFFLVVAAGSNPRIASCLSAAPLRRCGLASYSIYLIHYTVVFLLVQRWFPHWDAAIAGLLSGLFFWAVCERHFTNGPLRDAAVERVERILRLPSVALHRREVRRAAA